MGALDEFGIVPACVGFFIGAFLIIFGIATWSLPFVIVGVITIVVAFGWLWLWKPYTKYFVWE